MNYEEKPIIIPFLKVINGVQLILWDYVQRAYLYEQFTMMGDDYTKNLAPDFAFFNYGYRVYISSEQLPDPLSTLTPEQSKSLLDWLVKMIVWIFSGSKPPMPEIPKEILPDKPTPVPANNLLNTFCLAIKKHEGWILNPPSRSVRNNNPGNCRYSSVGYLPIYEPVKKDAQNFAIFKDYATGFLYLKNLVKSKVKAHPTWTFYQFFENYAPSFENDSRRYAEIVAKECTLSPNTQVSVLL